MAALLLRKRWPSLASGESRRSPGAGLGGVACRRMSIALARLAEERKQWRKDHPSGFVARPRKQADGSTDLMHWEAIVPGKEGTVWEGAEIPMELEFPDSFPIDPPIVKFSGKPVLWHLNVWSSGMSKLVWQCPCESAFLSAALTGLLLSDTTTTPTGQLCLNIINPPDKSGSWHGQWKPTSEFAFSIKQALEAHWLTLAPRHSHTQANPARRAGGAGQPQPSRRASGGREALQERPVSALAVIADWRLLA